MNLREGAYNRSMPVYMCRWPNGDLSFVAAKDKATAIMMLDEWGNAELAELHPVQDFMADFKLNDEGELELQALGEATDEAVWEGAYPVLAGALSDDHPDAETVREAVQAERKRLAGKKRGKLAKTDAGRRLQQQLGMPAVLADRQIEEAGKKVLERLPSSGRKQ